MPLYEYECKKCHHRFERIVKFSDPPMKKCPDCRGTVEQVISAPAVQFKGSGWYVTDYAKKSGSVPPSSSSSDSSEGNASSKDSSAKESTKDSETKKDSKPKSEIKESKKTEKK